MPPPAGVRAHLTVTPLEDRLTPAAGDLVSSFGNPPDGGGGVARVIVPTENLDPDLADPFTISRVSGNDAALLSNGSVAVVGSTGYTYGEYYLDSRFRPIYEYRLAPPGGPNLTTVSDTRDFAVALLTDSGVPVAGFGTNGVARIAIDESDDYKGEIARAVALQPAARLRANGQPDYANGNLIVGGVGGLPVIRGYGDGNPNDFGPQDGQPVGLVARVNLTGALETGFGTNGVVKIQFGDTANGYSAGVSDVAVYVDPTNADFGKVVAVSSLTSNRFTQYTTPRRIGFQVARLNANGTDDVSFGTGGRVFIDLGALANFGDADRPARVKIQPDGKIVVAGCVAEQGGALYVARLNVDGSLDAGFGTGGILRVAVAAAGGAGTSVGGVEYYDPTSASTPNPAGDEVLLVAGGDGADFFVARVTAAGQLDPGFGTNGIARLGIDTAGGNRVDAATGIGVEPTGKIVLGGRANRLSTRTDDFDSFAAARLLADGTPDPAFNGGRGRVYDQVGAGVGFGTAGAAGNVFVIGGDIVLAGSLETTNGEFKDGRSQPPNRRNSQLVVVRLENDATFNPTPPLPPLPEDPSTRAVASRFAVGGPPGRVIAAAIDELGRLNPPANDPLGILPTIFGFDGVLRAASTGDVNGDGQNDYAVVTGPGTPARFAVLSGRDLQTLLIPVTPAFAGSEGFLGGAFVSSGDIDGDGRAEVVLTPDRGGGPRVTIYSLPATGGLATRTNFLGLADGNFRGGARSAVGDVNNDGFADLLVAAGLGGGPRVSLYDGRTVFSTRTRLTADFFVFDTSLRDGVFAAIGDVTGDGFGDLVFGAGDGGSPRLTVVSGQTLLTRGSRAAVAAPVANFFIGGDETARSGVRVAVVDLDRDNRADVAVGSGPGVGAQVRVYPGVSLSGGEPGNAQLFLPLEGAVLADGIYVG